MVLVCVVLAVALVIVTLVAYRSKRTLAKLERGMAAARQWAADAADYPELPLPRRSAHALFNVVAPKLEARIALQEQDRQQLRAVLGG